MKRIISFIFILMLIITMGVGCKGKDKNVEDSLDNNDISNEEIEDDTEANIIEEVKEIEYIIYLKQKSTPFLFDYMCFISEDDERLKDKTIEEIALEDLINIDGVENLETPVPEGTKVLSLIKEGNTVIVDLSREFIENMGSDSTDTKMAITSIVNTLTILEGNERVIIKVEGKNIDSINSVRMNKEFEYSGEFFPNK